MSLGNVFSYHFFLLSNISLGCLKERSQGNISFTHQNDMLLLRVIKIYDAEVLFSEFSVSQPRFILN